MSRETRRPIVRWTLIGLVSLVGFAILCHVIGSSVRYRRVERAIKQFERNPSHTGAGALAELLQNYTATSEQGSRILTLLRRPTITARSTYAAGRPVWIALERPYHLSFRDTMSCRDEIGIVQSGDQHISRHSYSPATVQINGLSAEQAKPGVHQLTARGFYSVAFRRPGGLSEAGHWAGDLLRKMGLSPRRGSSLGRVYKCEFETPFEVTVAPEDRAETIELVSSSQLGDAMVRAFELGVSRDLGSYRAPSGRTRHATARTLRYRDLPVSAVFRVRLHLSDESGPETVLEDPKPLIAMAGTSGNRSLSCWFNKPGTYTGTVVLHPDLTRAYQDPTIKTIWAETVEFPISFTVEATPVSAGPQAPMKPNETTASLY